jgi:hypothetical protein
MLRSLPVLMLLVPVCPAPAAAQVKIAWKLKEGDRFFVTRVDRVCQTARFYGNESRQDLEQTKVTRFTLLKRNNDGSELFEQKIETVKVKPASAGPTVSVLKQLEGASFQLTFDARRRVTRVAGYQRFVDQAAKDNPANAKLVRTLLTEDSFKTTAEELLGFVPDKEVANGDSWQKKLTFPLGPVGTLALSNTYTLDTGDEASGLAKISLSGKASYKPPVAEIDPSVKIGGGNIRLVKSAGELQFDIRRGRVLRLEYRQTLQGTFHIIMRDANVDMEFSQDQDVSLSVAEK